VIFRHLLRFILLCHEFAQIAPPEGEPQAWKSELRELAEAITECCRSIDPDSTDKAIEAALAAPDVVQGEAAPVAATAPPPEESELEAFGAGLDDA
jgi:hypothetical protein